MTSQGKRTFRISGQVIDTQHRGIAGLRVEAWDKDLIFDDLLGAAVTDEQGAFHMEFDRAFFKEIFLDRYPDLYFKVFYKAQLLKSTEDAVLWNVKAEDTTITIELDLPATGPAPPPGQAGPFVVQGQIQQEQDKRPLAGITVKAFDKDLRQEEFLGAAQTNDAGHYEIHYSAEQFSRAEKKGADLIVRAYSQQGVLLGESKDIRFNAKQQEVIDLVVSPPPPVSQFEELLAVLKPILRELQPADLTDADIAFLCQELAGEPAVEEGRLGVCRTSGWFG